MPWFKVDDGFGSSRQVMAIPKRQRAAAVGFWTLAGAWSAKELTDGFIPAYMLPELSGTAKLAGELVTCGLWDEVANGFAFKVWSKYNPTADQVRSKRSDDAERKRTQRRSGSGQYENASTSDDLEMSARTDSGVRAESKRSPSGVQPSRPDPTHTNKEKTPATVPDGFDEFWSAYPKKVDKGAARRAWGKATSKASVSEIVSGAERYRDDSTRSDKYTKSPATWLNAESWGNESAPAKRVIAGGRWEEI